MSAVSAAAVAFAMVVGTAAFAVFVAVMIANGIGIEMKSSCQERSYLSIRISGCTGVKSDACLCQGISCSAADAAADQNLNAMGCKEACKCTVAAAVGIHYLAGEDLSVLRLINLKLFGVSEMLENLSVFVSNCNFHV